MELPANCCCICGAAGAVFLENKPLKLPVFFFFFKPGGDEFEPNNDVDPDKPKNGEPSMLKNNN